MATDWDGYNEICDRLEDERLRREPENDCRSCEVKPLLRFLLILVVSAAVIGSLAVLMHS